MKWLFTLLFVIFAATATANASGELTTETTKQTAEQILTISNTVKDYKKKFGHLPGDKDKDGVIGTGDITKLFNVGTSASPSDETAIFWQELRKNGGLKSFNFIKKGEIEYPQAAIAGTYFIVGFFNGAKETLQFTNKPLRGHVLVLVRDKTSPNEDMEFPVTGKETSDIDEDLDDGDPASQLVRGYGECVAWTQKGSDVRRLGPRIHEPPKYKYLPPYSERSCGLIVKISD